MNFKKRKSKKAPPGESFDLVLIDKTGLQIRDPFGFQMQPFDYNKDLNTQRHDGLITGLKTKLASKVKDVRRFALTVVQQDISYICDSTLHLIQADLEHIRLQVESGKVHFQNKQKSFNKDEKIKHYTDTFLKTGETALLQRKEQLTINVREQKAKRHLILEKLNHLKHQADDYLHEIYKGKSPKKHWYNR